MKFTCIDAFSGSGGLSLGLKSAGFDIIYSFDKDPDSIATQLLNNKYIRHKTEVVDINSLLNGKIRDKIGKNSEELFLLAGGPPCQGFSIQRIGEDADIRNDLIFRMLDLIIELKPHYFVIENVPGITGKRGKTFLSDFIKSVTHDLYHVTIGKLDASNFNVPQRRKRIFIVGENLIDGAPNFTFPRPLKNKITVRTAIGHLPPPPSNGKDHPNIKNHRSDKLSELNLRRIISLRPGEGRDNLPEDLLANCHKVSSSIIGHRKVYGRMSWDDVAPTITARFDSFTRGQFGHPEQNRSISLREGALLQTFPKDYVFSGTKVSIARQIGNAVPVNLAKALGLQIIHCYKKKKASKS